MDLLRKLLAGTSRLLLAPENDQGAEFEDDAPGADDDFDIDDSDEELDGEDTDQDGADDEDGDESEDLPAPQQQRRPSANETIAAQRRENRELRERLDRIERQPPQAPQLQQRAPTAAERQAYLETLDPETRTQFLLNEQAQYFDQRINALSFNTADTADKAAFDSLCSRTPAAAAVKDKVEKRLQEMRAAGTTAPRETVLRWVIGDLALERAGRAGGKQRRAADQARQRQTARPTTGRGDVAGGGNRRLSEAEARRKRLDDVQI